MYFVLNAASLVFSVMSRHIDQTGHIQKFVIVQEEGIAKGIRRLVVLTGVAAREVGFQL